MVTVSGDHAIADWAQGQMGGRALVRAGVPATDARKLERERTIAEAKLPPEKAAMFSRFEGLVMMDGEDGAAPHPHPRH